MELLAGGLAKRPNHLDVGGVYGALTKILPVALHPSLALQLNRRAVLVQSKQLA